MKKSRYFILLGIFAIIFVSCAPFSKPVDKSRCYHLTGMVNYRLKISLNENNRKKRSYYPRSYVVQVYKDLEMTSLESQFLLPRKKDWPMEIYLNDKTNQNYCIAVYKDPTIGTFKQIGWKLDGVTAVDLVEPKYYVSTSKMILPFATRIVSKNGATGDGVKVLID